MRTLQKLLVTLVLLFCAPHLRADPELIAIISKPVPPGSYLSRSETTDLASGTPTSDLRRIHLSERATVIEYLNLSPEGERITIAQGYTPEGVFIANYTGSVVGGRIEIIEGSAEEILAHEWASGLRASTRAAAGQLEGAGLSYIDPTSFVQRSKPDSYEARIRQDHPWAQRIRVERLREKEPALAWAIYFSEPEQVLQRTIRDFSAELMRFEGMVRGKNARTGENYGSSTITSLTRLSQTMLLGSLDQIAARYIRPDSVILRENLTTGSRMQKNGEGPWIPSVRPPPPLAATPRWPLYTAFAFVTFAALAVFVWLRRRHSAAAR